MLNLLKVLVRPVHPLEEQHFQKLMQAHHYLGALPKISETLWYVATFADQWVALLSFSAAALKCSARDRWIGWDFRHQYDRLKLVTNNSRFLILPDWHFPNLASRILSFIPDPRRAQGRRHRLSTVLSIAAGATLCGMHGYLAISDWTKNLSQRARRRFSCRYQNKRYIVPSLSTIRDVLIRVDPVHLDRALQRWNQAYGQHDESLAIDGKTMCNAIDDQGYQTHIMSAVGHQSKTCYTQKK